MHNRSVTGEPGAGGNGTAALMAPRGGGKKAPAGDDASFTKCKSEQIDTACSADAIV